MPKPFEVRRSALDSVVAAYQSKIIIAEINKEVSGNLERTKSELIKHANDLRIANTKGNNTSIFDFFRRTQISPESLKPLTPEQATELESTIEMLTSIIKYINGQNAVDMKIKAISNVTRKPNDVLYNVTGDDRDEKISLLINLEVLKKNNNTDKGILKILQGLYLGLTNSEEYLNEFIKATSTHTDKIIAKHVNQTQPKSFFQEEPETKLLSALTQITDENFETFIKALRIDLDPTDIEVPNSTVEKNEGPKRAW